MKTNRYSLLVSAVLLMLSVSTFAQNFGIVLFEDFDATTTPDGWTQSTNQTFPAGISSTTPSGGWAFGAGPYSSFWDVPASLDASPFAISNDDAADQNRLEDLLMSPVMDLTPFDSAIFLYETFYDSLFQVSEGYFFISYDAGTTWLNLPLTATTFANGWIEDGIILPRVINVGGNNYTFNDQMMIGFFHTDNGGWGSGVAVDNVIVAGYNTPCDDVVTIPSCDAPQTVTLAGPGVLDWEFTTGCGFTTFGQEQLYSFTPTVSGVHTIEVSSTTELSFLDYMYKPVSAGCDTLGWNCVADVFAAGEYGGMDLTAGVEYYILVDNEFIDAETQTFSIKCPCTYTSLNGTDEGETCGNTDNNGCALDPAPPTYGNIACGETISGTTFANGGTRDVDYFEFTIGSDLDLEFEFGGGLPLNALIIDNCTDFNVLANASSASCQSNTLSYAAAAGTYYLVIVPTSFNGYTCGSAQAIYDVAMSCSCPETFDAGTITADAAPCYDASPVVISATPDGNQVVPTGYVQGYALTEGGVVTQVAATPSFTANATGDYTIHTVVYDANEIDPSTAIGLPAADVNELLVQGGGSICAGLDLTGATVTVVNCPPANDLCGGAVTVACDDVVSGTTEFATATDAPTSGVSEGVWYSFIGTGDDVTVSTCTGTSWDTEIVVSEGACGSLTTVVNNDDACGLQSSATFSSVLGTEYFIYVGDFSGSTTNSNSGDFELTVTCLAPPPPLANDAPCDAIALVPGLNGQYTNVGATADSWENPGVIPAGTNGGGSCTSSDGWCSFETVVDNSTWFSFVAPASGKVTITMTGDFDTQIAIFSGNDCQDVAGGNGTLVAANDDNPAGSLQSFLAPCGLTPGETYFLMVDGYSGEEGNYSITLTEEDLTADFTSSAAGLVVDFTDASSSTNTIVGWAWDFDDAGATSIDQNPQHTFSADGTYNVCLTVTDENGCEETTCIDVTVQDITTSIAEALDRNMVVYPNPSNGAFVVEITGVESMAQLNVMDLTGRVIYTEAAVLNGNFRKDVNLNVASGTYLLQVITEEGMVTRKLQVK